jgi:hypothetical protein
MQDSQSSSKNPTVTDAATTCLSCLTASTQTFFFPKSSEITASGASPVTVSRRPWATELRVSQRVPISVPQTRDSGSAVLVN